MDLGIVGQAAGLFAVTNIDDILVLALFFAQGAPQGPCPVGPHAAAPGPDRHRPAHPHQRGRLPCEAPGAAGRIGTMSCAVLRRAPSRPRPGNVWRRTRSGLSGRCGEAENVVYGYWRACVSTCQVRYLLGERPMPATVVAAHETACPQTESYLTARNGTVHQAPLVKAGARVRIPIPIPGRRPTPTAQ